MTREEFDMLTSEQQSDLINKLLESTEQPKGTWWHFKPSYAFQCAEADLFVTEDNEAEIAEEISRAIRIMMATAPEQPDANKKPAAKKKEYVQPKVPLATENQKKLMDKLDIWYDEKSTYEYADKTIKFYLKSKDTHPGMHPVRVTLYDSEFNAFCAEIDCQIPADEYECDDDNMDYIFIDEDTYKSLVRKIKKSIGK